MTDEDINYVKEVLKSQVNLAFIGVMVFLTLVISFWGFAPLLLAGEIGALFIAQNSRIQRLIRAKKNKAMPIKIEIAVSRKWAKVEKPAFLMKSMRASGMVKLIALFDKQFPELLARVTGQ